MADRPKDMWANGRLRHDATREELLAEMDWQKAWRKEVRQIDGNNYRGIQGTDNIMRIKERLRRMDAQ